MPELAGLGVISKLDRAILATYCSLWATWRECVELVQRDGLVITTKAGPKKHPACTVRVQAFAAISRCAMELGLTPSARTRLSVEKPSEPNEFDLFLQRGRENKDRPLPKA